MARRWFVSDTDGVINGFTEDDDVAAAAGYTATEIPLDATGVPVNGPASGGTWDSGTSIYTLSPGQASAYDPTTLLGRKKIAFTALHDQLFVWRDAILELAFEKPQVDVSRALQFLAMAHWAAYVVAQMHTAGDLTLEQIEAWCGAMSIGSADITTAHTYYEKAHALMEIDVPLEACAWADPSDAARKNLEDARTNSTNNGAPTTTSYFLGQTIELSSVDLGAGQWIRELTA